MLAVPSPVTTRIVAWLIIDALPRAQRLMFDIVVPCGVEGCGCLDRHAPAAAPVGDAVEGAEEVVEVVVATLRSLQDLCPSRLCTMKFHLLEHWRQVTERLGSWSFTGTETGEGALSKVCLISMGVAVRMCVYGPSICMRIVPADVLTRFHCPGGGSRRAAHRGRRRSLGRPPFISASCS